MFDSQETVLNYCGGIPVSFFQVIMTLPQNAGTADKVCPFIDDFTKTQSFTF